MATTTFTSAYAQRSTRGNGRHVLPETFREKHGRPLAAILLTAVMLTLLTGAMTLLYRAGMDLGSVALIVASIFIGGAMFTAMLILISASRE
jgi:biotin transporter BioY